MKTTHATVVHAWMVPLVNQMDSPTCACVLEATLEITVKYVIKIYLANDINSIKVN